MKNIYLIASPAAKYPEAEKPLWDYLEKKAQEKGWPVLGAFEMVRYLQRAVSIVEPGTAEAIKKRLEGEPVVLINLRVSPETLKKRIPGKKEKFYTDRIEASERLEEDEKDSDGNFLWKQDGKADYSVSSEDLSAAAELIVAYIESLEHSSS